MIKEIKTSPVNTRKLTFLPMVRCVPRSPSGASKLGAKLDQLKFNSLICSGLGVYYGHEYVRRVPLFGGGIALGAPPANRAPCASIQRPSLGMDHTAERIAQAAHIIRRIPSQQERERIIKQLEEDGDFNAEGIEAVRRLVGYSA